jgi:hypothetical protein
MRILTGALLALALGGWAATAGAQAEGETKARVPELTAFHEVIYPMWHSAYPAGDTTALRALWPDIRKHVEALGKAELPGILRDRKGAWLLGLEQLAAAERAYGDALEKHSTEELLAAAEGLHAAFERLVRTIRPILPELADFHEVLYRIYHYCLPGRQQQELMASLPALTAEMDTLGRAALPERLARSRARFNETRSALSARVKEVARVAPRGDWARTTKAVEAMHSAYQEVERVFD